MRVNKQCIACGMFMQTGRVGTCARCTALEVMGYHNSKIPAPTNLAPAPTPTTSFRVLRFFLLAVVTAAALCCVALLFR